MKQTKTQLTPHVITTTNTGNIYFQILFNVHECIM